MFVTTLSSARGAWVACCDSLDNLRQGALAAALVLTTTIGPAHAGSAQAGSTDPTFNVVDNGAYGDGAQGPSGWSIPVRAIVRQPDGKVLIGGDFQSFNNLPRAGVARLNSDGSVDTSFDPGTGLTASLPSPITANSIALQPDGKLLIGGQFDFYNGAARKCIARVNPDGSLDTTFNPGASVSFGTLNAVVSAVAVQPDGKVLIGGTFTAYDGVPREHFVRLHADGSLDSSFNPSAGGNQSVTAIVLQPDGKALIGGYFTAYDNTASDRIARVNTDGTIDTSFNPGTGANSAVTALALQPDGKLLIGGSFTIYNDIPQIRVARVNTDGSLDTSFDPGTGPNSSVHEILPLADGKVLLGGEFTSYDGATRNHFARVNSNGSLDSSFGAGAGANSPVFAITAQPDGKLLVGGHFTNFNGSWCSRITRLHADGSPDTSFNPGPGALAPVKTMAVQPDGKILIGGDFSSYNNTDRSRIARVNSDGSLDTSFNPGAGASVTVGANAFVQSIALQSDGKVLIGGNFDFYNGIDRRHIARLNADGSLDASFDPGAGANAVVQAVALQPDGKVLIGGFFTSVNGTARNLIARLNSDGSLDASFDPGTGAQSQSVNAIAVQPDGKVLIGGAFVTYNGTPRRRIARLNSNGSLDTSFDPGTGLGGPPGTSLSAIVLQPDGKILIGGAFTAYNAVARQGVARVNADGSLDTSFNTSTGAAGNVAAMVLQADGRVLIGGLFGSFNGTAANDIARVNSDGSLDTGFDAGAGVSGLSTAPRVLALAQQPDGKLLVGGDFTSVDGAPRHRIARVFTVAPGVATSYCTSGTSAIGCTPTISTSGVASAAATSGYFITTNNIEGQRQTNTFYSVLGPKTPPTPFGAGFLCVKTPTQRIGSAMASGTPGLCDGSVSIDVLAWAQTHPTGQGVPYTVGTTLNFQCSIRDPLSPGTRVMSDAVQVTLQP